MLWWSVRHSGPNIGEYMNIIIIGAVSILLWELFWAVWNHFMGNI